MTAYHYFTIALAVLAWLALRELVNWFFRFAARQRE